MLNGSVRTGEEFAPLELSLSELQAVSALAKRRPPSKRREIEKVIVSPL